MSATDELDELRRLLNKHGLEWREHEAPATDCIAFCDGNGWHDCWESAGGEVNVTFSMTPEQAIEATLGRRTTTRHGKFRTKYGRSVPCCECCGYGIGDTRWRYCPSCGAKVVE